MHTQGLQISTPTDTTVVLTRAFNAPRRLVWQAMTNPEKMQRWMLPPPGWSMSACECRPAVGGVLKLAWKNPENSVLTLLGVFTEIAVNDRMTHTEVMTMDSGQIIGSQIETHEFTESAGKTTMRITQVYESKDARDCAVGSGMDCGMEAGFARLDELLAQGE